MPAGGFKTFTAGAVLTASDVNAYLMQGVLVFSSEAARNAAISAPQEGMTAMITTPSTPAATGGVTAVPGTILTVYNGSAWVCVTPVGAYTNNQGATTSTSFTTSLTGSPGTNPSVTLSTGTTAKISISAMQFMGGAGSCYTSVAVSGATTIAASINFGILNASTNQVSLSRTFIMTGLTAGANTFTLSYQGAASNAAFESRSIVVEGIM